MRGTLFIGLLLSNLVAGSLTAATIHVDDSNPTCPGDGSAANPFCLIQDAIVAVSPGDTVLVANGVYSENLDFLGKPITVTSVTSWWNTLIQSGAPGSVVRFDSGEQSDSVLEGFDIRDGSGTLVSWGAGTALAGGGIFCSSSSPTIRDNMIEGNSGPLYGGGIFCEGGAPTISGNDILSNHAEGGGGILLRDGCNVLVDSNDISSNSANQACGGGFLILSGSSPTIRNNQLFGNSGDCGGGIASLDSAPLIHDNLIWFNGASNGEGGGLFVSNSSADIQQNQIINNTCRFGGGGVAFLNGDVTLAGNLIQDNQATVGNGGGILGTVTLAVIRDNVVEENDASDIGGGMSLQGDAQIFGNTVRDNLNRGGIACFSGTPQIVDNLVLRNQGSGIECLGPTASPTLRRNTILGNRFGAVFVDLGASVTISSSILRGNGSPPDNEILIASGSAVVSWSNVQGGYAGTGNIDQDPQFINPAQGDYSLALSSPCVDAGDPADLDCGTGFSGEPRRLDGLLNGTREVDMGARECGNIRLDLTVDEVTPSLTIDVSGTAGLNVLLFVSLDVRQTCSRYGVFLLDPGPGLLLFPWGAIPSSVVVYPQPQALQIETHWQAAGLGAGPVGIASNRVSIGGS